jgi:2-polyprenyl-6-methoxyphenol hydroxylase-like FAD-dependent oxidoreductase
MAEPEILVVGAGPTGLALACELFRAGVPCRVVEEATARSGRSKGIAIWPRTCEILHDLGVADEAMARGLALAKGTLWSRGEPLTTFDLTEVGSRFRCGLVLPQYETEALLERRLVELGGKVERGVRCTALDLPPGGLPQVTLQSSDGVERIEAGWVVGCDGPGSFVRQAAGIAADGELERYGWILADVRMETSLPPEGVNWFLHGGAVLHALPMPGGQWRLTATVGQERPDPADWPLERLGALVAERSPVPMRLTELAWASGFRVRQGLARRFRQGRVVLAGDAAHVHSPAGAQGVNAGLQDAANLGWKLALVRSGQAPESLLDSYDAERRPAAATTVLLTGRATKGATLAGSAARAGRDLLWSTAGRRGVVQRVVPPAVAGVLQSYPAGLVPASGASLAVRRARAVVATVRGRPATGSRLPDVPLANGDQLWDLLPATGSAVLAWAGRGRLWDDVDGFTALHRAVPPGVPVFVVDSPGLPADRMPDEPGWRVLPDLGGRVRRALRARADTAVVVRPDRYLGARDRASGPGRIREFFRIVGSAV